MTEADRKRWYEVCSHIKRTKPDLNVDEDLAKSIGSNYRVIPTFENSLFEQKYIKHYSLNRNELLKCRWTQYKKYIEERVMGPFQFPDVRDLHLQNGNIQFLPTLSIHRMIEKRKHMKPGPGVDQYGQMPIPMELLMKRGRTEKEKKHRKVQTTKPKNSK